jgi:hypothetical protein
MARQLDDLQRLLIRELTMARESFEQLQASVAKATTVKEAAIVLIKAMGDRLTELGDHPSPAEMQALAAAISAHDE